MSTTNSRSLPASIVAASIAVACYYTWRSYTSPQRKLPPGPQPDPLIGNLRHLPLQDEERVFAELRNKYGDIIYMQVLGQGILVLNSLQAAHDLMERRSWLYSDRPRIVSFCELMGWDATVSLMPFGEAYKRHRHLVQDYFGNSKLESFRSVQSHETFTFLSGLLEDPKLFVTHIKRFTAGIVMQTTYGHEIESVEDQYVKLADVAFEASMNYGKPSTALVDIVPALKYIPIWMPGVRFRRRMEEIRLLVRAMIETPYEMVKQKMSLGTCPPCFCCITRENHTKLFPGLDSDIADEDVKGIAGTLYGASDTVTSALHTFVLAMVMYPEVYKKAQEEIDTVVGGDRLPDLEDREKLPYFMCVLKEVYRWNPPIPLGVPHKLMEQDDEYRGYFIPKDTTVIANIWGMLHNPEIYPDPDKFDPERFMRMSEEDAKLHDPREAIFGFGRRLCPGKLFGDANLFLAAAGMTATMDILPIVDDKGNEPRASFVGTISQPRPFKCNIQPRSDSCRELILEGGNRGIKQ